MRILMIVENCAFLRDPRVRREAKALQAAGHKVSVVCPRDSGRPWRERVDGIAIYRFRPCHAGISRRGYLLEYTCATLWIAVLSLIVLIREGFDIIHVANPPDTLVLTTVWYKLLGKKIIYDQHDLCPELYSAKFAHFSPRLLALLRWLERQSYRLADHVITTNDSYKEVAITRGKISDSKVTVVRNGPDLKSLSKRDADPDLRGRAKNILVYTGIVGSQDGLDCLCRILHHLRYGLERKDFCCVVMGDGDALPCVKALAQELRLQENVWFAGWIDDPETYLRYLNTADICVSPEPSNDYNNRSTFVKIMEYMAAGKPIVGFELTETRFSARDSAIYVAANDEREFAVQLTRLMDDPRLRIEMGRRGQNRIRQELAWQYSIPKLLMAYEKCVKFRQSFSENPEHAAHQRGANTKTDAGAEFADVK